MSAFLNNKRDEDHIATPSNKSLYNQTCKECGHPIHYRMGFQPDSSDWMHGYPTLEQVEHTNALLVSNTSKRHYSLPENKTTSLCRLLRDGKLEDDAWMHTTMCRHCIRLKTLTLPERNI